MAVKRRHPQVRNPFERRKPRRSELRAAKDLAKAAGVIGMFEARENEKQEA
jgi:hypothetical protein